MKKFVLFLFLMLVLLPMSSYAFDVTLAWDASTSGDVNEYIIHYDTVSGPTKGNSISVGDVLEGEITNLPDGVMYYFHVTCKDTEGRESGPSNEVQTDGVTSPDTGQDPAAPGCWIETITP